MPEACWDISQGYAFFCVPWNEYGSRFAPREGCEESSTPLRGAVLGVGRSPGVRKKRVPLAIIQARLRRAQFNLRFRISDLRCRNRPISSFLQGIVFKASFNTGILCTG